MAPISFFHVDAFTSKAFGGAAATVFVCEGAIEADVAQALTSEARQPVSVFLRPSNDSCQVRYFTEAGDEVGHVGHAGLAAAFVLLRRVRPGAREAILESPVGGSLPAAHAEDGGVAIELAAMPREPCPDISGVREALGGLSVKACLGADFGPVAVLEDEESVRKAAPRMALVERIEGNALILTAVGRGADFVSRVFAPKLGLPEDPVCGTAHRILVPYWSERLGRSRLTAHQLSWRGGVLDCELDDGRVRLSGNCVSVMDGQVDRHLLSPA